MRTGALTTMDITEVTRRWPTLGTIATDHGVGAFLAAPLTGGGNPASYDGTLNLYSAATTGFTDIEEDLITVLSGLLSRALPEHTAVRAAPLEAAQLREAMASRAVIEQAKASSWPSTRSTPTPHSTSSAPSPSTATPHYALWPPTSSPPTPPCNPSTHTPDPRSGDRRSGDRPPRQAAEAGERRWRWRWRQS